MFDVLKDSCRKVVKTDDVRSYLPEHVADPATQKSRPTRDQDILPLKRSRVDGSLNLIYVFLDYRVFQSRHLTFDSSSKAPVRGSSVCGIDFGPANTGQDSLCLAKPRLT